jgi:hypothetical protein
MKNLGNAMVSWAVLLWNVGLCYFFTGLVALDSFSYHIPGDPVRHVVESLQGSLDRADGVHHAN